MAGAVRAGEVSARELLDTCLARIAATDAQVNAFTSQTLARAQQEADVVDESRRQGAPLGPLAGVPYAVKNLYDIEDVTTLAGSKINRSHAPASADAFLIQQMKAAGAVLVGALNMDEYAYGFTTENTHYGPCRNLHDLMRIAGGSSGGSGAAVAAGQVSITLGSDTNGSIRVPASLCGVWGLKPTFGRLSRRGTYPFVYSLDHLGPMANSLASLALAFPVCGWARWAATFMTMPARLRARQWRWRPTRWVLTPRCCGRMPHWPALRPSSFLPAKAAACI